MAKPKQEQLGTITILDEDGSGNITASNAKITNLGTPTVGTDAVTKAYVDGYSGWKNANIASDAYIAVNKLAPGTNNYVLKTVDGVPVWSAGGGGVSDHGDLTGLADDDHLQYLRTDGTRAFTGNQSADGYKITNLGIPTASGDAANKSYIDGYGIATNTKQGFVPVVGANTTLLQSNGVSSSWVDLNTINHNSLGSLTTGDPHTQYVHNTTARTITAQHTLNPTGAPFIIGANATNQLVSGLNADKVDGYDASVFLHANGSVSMSGNLNANNNKIINLATPTLSTDAVTKAYVDGYSADHNALQNLTIGDPHTQYLRTDGTRALTGNLSAGSNKITNLGTPTAGTDAVTKAYVDGYQWTNSNIATGANIAVNKLASGTDGYYLTTSGGIPTWAKLNGTIDGYNLSDIFETTQEPSGFPNRTESTISVNEGTRTFSIAPVSGSFSFFLKGVRYYKNSTQSVTWTDVEGVHFFYYDMSATLQHTTDVATWAAVIAGNGANVAALFWDATNDKVLIFNEERHGLMPGIVHSHFHNAFGTQWYSGGALYGFTIGSGNAAADAYFGVTTPTVIADEDIRFTITHGAPQNLNTPAQIPVFYRLGASGDWRRKTADSYPIIYSGTAGYTGASGRLPYNQWTGSAWQLTEVANGDFVLVHYFAVTDMVAPIIGIQGQTDYSTLANAQAGAATEIANLSGLLTLLSTEYTPLGTVIYQSATGYNNTAKAKVVQPSNGGDYVDFRKNRAVGTAASIASHGSLSGLANDDHLQYVHNTNARTITAQHTLNPTGAPFIVGANATNQLVSGLNADKVDGYDATAFLHANGSVSLSGNLNANNNKIINLATPTLSADATTKAYVDGYQHDHGGLVGLADDDHTQYLRTDGTRETTGNFTFAQAVVSPSISQTNETANSTNGDSLTVQAQNATGTTSTGGNLILTSGSGTSADGYVNIAVGGKNRLNIRTYTADAEYSAIYMGMDGYTPSANNYALRSSQLNHTYLNSVAGGGVFLSTGGSDRFSVSGSFITSFISTFRFQKDLSTPLIRQDDATGVASVGNNFTLQAQNSTGSGATVGGNLFLKSGTGATDGYVGLFAGSDLRLNVNDAYSVFSHGGSTGNVIIQEQPTQSTYGAVFIGLGSTVPSSTNFTLRANNSLTELNAPTTIRLSTGGAVKLQITTSSVGLIPPLLTFDYQTNSPKINQTDETRGDGYNGDPLTIQAQNSTAGTTTIGGDLLLQSGTGVSKDGYAYIKTGNTNRIVVGTTDTRITGYGSGGGFIFRDQVSDAASNTIYPGGVTPTASNHIISTTSGNSNLYINSTGAQRFTISNTLKLYVGSEVGTYTNFYFDNGTVNPKLYQLDEATSTSSDSLTIQAQNNTVAGSTGGDLQLQSGTGTLRDGYVRIRTGGYGGTKERVVVDGYSVKFDFTEPGATTRRSVNYIGINSSYDAGQIWLGLSPLTAQSDTNYTLYSNNTTTRVNGNQNVYFAINGTIKFRLESGNAWVKSDYEKIVFDETLSNPIFYQNQNTATDAVGSPLTIQAQNVPNGSNSVGGNLILQSGDGNLRDGYVYIKTDGNTRLTVQPDGNISVNNGKIKNLSTPTDAYDAATKEYVDANGGGSVPTGAVNTVYWSDGATNSFTASPRFTKAISADGYTFGIEVDGYNAGTFGDGYLGLATNFANSGVLRLPNNQSISARNSSNDDDVLLLKANTTDDIEIGTGVNVFDVNVGGIEFNSSLSSPSIKQTTTTDAYAVAAPLYVQAQSATGTTSTGGDLILGSGSGTSSTGNVDIYTGTANRVNITNTAANFNFGGSTGYVSIRDAVGASTYGSIYMGLVPTSFTSTNYVLRSNSSATELNASTTINLQTAGTTRLQATSGSIVLVPQLLTWSASIVNPKINQTDSTAASDTGDTLTIQAQNATGTTSTGGNLVLTSGTGTSADGYVAINNGSSNRAIFRSYTADTTYSALYMDMDGYAPGTNNFILRTNYDDLYINTAGVGMTLQTAGSARLAVSASFITFHTPSVRFINTASDPFIRQDDRTGDAGVGVNLTIQAQNSTGTGATVGGNLMLKSGTGVTDGYVGIFAGNDLRLNVNDAYSVFSHGGSTGNVIIRDLVGSSTNGAIYLGLGSTAQSATNYSIYSDNTNININAASSTFIRSANTARLQIANTIDSYVSTLQWKDTVNNPILTQIDNTTASATATSMTVQAQNATGTTSIGGDLVLVSGTGTTRDGYLYLKTGSTNKLKVSTILEPQVDFRLPKDKQIQFVNEAGDGYVKALSKDGYNAVVVGDPSNASAIDIRTDGYIDIYNSVLKIGNVSTVPSTDPSSGAYLYTQNGAIKGRGSSGTVTTIAPAHPHCPHCGRDFAFEAENKYGEILSFCFSCLVDEVKRIGGDTNNFIIQRKQR